MAALVPVIPKQNAVASTPPLTTALALGELAFNVRDGTLWAKYRPDGVTDTILQLNASGGGGAPVNSPTFTGIPAAPTPAADTNTTQIATTAYVIGQASSSTPLINSTAAIGTSLRYARADHVHPVDTSRAALASPTFTGVPAAPTAAALTSTTQLATTAFVTPAVAVETTRATTAEALLAPKASPALTGTPTAPTAAALNNSTQLATTAYADAATAVEKARALAAEALFAPLASPTFTGVPSMPTGAVGVTQAALNNTTSLATTAYVDNAVAASGGGGGPSPGTANPIINGTAAPGTSLLYSRQDHVHPIDTTRAPLASPTFTGTPSLPTGTVGITQAALNSSTALSTTAYVDAAVAAAAYLPLTSTGPQTVAASAGLNLNSSAGNVVINGGITVAAAGTVTIAHSTSITAGNFGIGAGATASFAGATTVVTQAVNDNSTKVASTAFVVGQVGTATPLIDGTAAVGTSLLYARQDHVHPSDTTRAALAGPTFTGVPAAPTAAASTNTTQLATTAFVVGQAGSATPLIDGTATVGTSLLFARQDHIHPTDTSRAALASPTFTGTPAAPTPTAGDSTTKLATTAFVTPAIATETSRATAAEALLAPLASPAFTGAPTAPTAAALDATTKIATTAYVDAAVTAGGGGGGPSPGTANPIVDGTAAPGVSSLYSRQDHVHPTDTSRSAVASPTFTGTPAAPTAAALTNTTQIATTAYADAAVAVEASARSTADALKANLASPTLTGTPAAPTAAASTNTTQLATTAFVVGQAGSATPIIDGTAAVGTSLLYARQDHVHPTDTTRSPLASPTFTGTVTIPGGAINATTMGATTPSTGAFTTLAASSTVTFSGLTGSTVMMLNSSKALVSATLSNGLTAGSGTLTITPSGIISTPPTAKTAAYTALQTDNNTTIPVNVSSSTAMTLPSLTAGTSITFAQRGTGKVTWTASGTTITVYPTGSTGSAGAGAQFTAFWDTATTILISGAVS